MNRTLAVLFAGASLFLLTFGGLVTFYFFSRAQEAEVRAMEAREVAERNLVEAEAQRLREERDAELDLPGEADLGQENERLQARLAELEAEVEALRAQLEEARER